jgi:ABC-type branched-subunit amino acid transport system substrate-binding protein
MTTTRAPIRRVMAAAAVMAIVASACTTSGSPTAAPATQAPASQAAASETPAQSGAASASAAAVSCVPERTDPIKMTHLNYYTGAFADVGPWFKGITDFPIGIINQDPPTGRAIEVLDADIGTLGEAAVSKKAIESDKVEILLNVAHNYPSYRDWMLAQQQANDGPPMPSVHGGAITRKWGGTVAEPLFRGAPQDSSQASAAALYASEDLGAKTVVVVATEIEGSQLQKPAAVNAAKKLGMTVLDTIDIASTQPSYRDVINKISNLKPDAVLIFSQAQDGGTFVKQAAEAGESWNIIGTTEWMGEAFPKSASMDAIAKHKNVLISGFANMPGPGWDFYKAAYEKFAPGVEALKNIVAGNSYNMQYYDLLNITALAIEKGCSTDASKWAPALRDVAMAPGTKCYSYAECLKLVRAGTDIDYSGASGEMDYNDTGVVAGFIGIFKWTSETNLELVKAMDGPAVVELDSVNE